MISPPDQAANLSGKEEPYFEAIGRFIVEYAAAEGAMHMLARHFSKMGDKKARIVFSGMRLADLAERIRGIVRADHIEESIQNEIDNCIIQLDSISTERNRIVHRYTSYHEDHITVTNIMTAKTVGAAERHIFQIDDLKNMTHDCLRIYLRMSFIVDNQTHLFSHPSSAAMLYGPWKYKPAPPAPKPKPHRGVPRSKRRQHRASRESQ